MDSNGDAYPSQARIARAACLSEKTVQPIIKALSARGEQWLAVQRHDIPGQAWKRFSYRPCVPDRIDLSKYEDLVAAHVRVNGDVE
jgi:hypothetical protein